VAEEIIAPALRFARFKTKIVSEKMTSLESINPQKYEKIK